MARLEGYECDTCHRHADGGWLGGTPRSWYDIRLWNEHCPDYFFCSQECLKQWVGSNYVPERARTLFKRWVKAVFGWGK